MSSLPYFFGYALGHLHERNAAASAARIEHALFPFVGRIEFFVAAASYVVENGSTSFQDVLAVVESAYE